jgi:Mn-dependent DtxR family transcriptional regulator
MGQYQIAEYLYENGKSTRIEIKQGVRLSSTSVSESVTSLKSKGLVKEEEDGIIFHPDASEEDLDNIKPTKLSDMMDSDS